MRCVVSTVTGDTNPELYEELGHAEAELHDDYDEEESTEPDDDEGTEKRCLLLPSSLLRFGSYLRLD